MKTIPQQLESARRCGVPLVAIETADPASVMRSVIGDDEAGIPPAFPPDKEIRIVRWDVINGFLKLNERADSILASVGSQMPGNLLEALKAMHKIPEDSVVFVLMGDRFLGAPPIVQAIWNLRDEFKSNGRMLVLIGASMDNMPAELRHDVVQFSEPLPDDVMLTAIVDDICQSCGFSIDDDAKSRIVDSIRGLSAFEAEQVVAMSTNRHGVSIKDCQDRKRQMVEKTKGLQVFNESHSFDDLAGLDQVKLYLTGLMNGPMRPKAVVWLDEIEKSGLAHTNDLSGVNSDSLGTVLSYMEDHKVFGVMLVGVPGCGKSEICKAMAKQFDTIVIRMDMGAMQGSLVGESQNNLRHALKTIDAICGDNALFIATSNSIEGLDSALKSRFTDTFFFDLPSEMQRIQAWTVHMTKFGISQQPLPDDDGWSGRNIQRCCQKAYSLGMTLRDAATFVIPEATQSREVIETLRTQASGKYLSADSPGAYVQQLAERKTRRVMSATA